MRALQPLAMLVVGLSTPLAFALPLNCSPPTGLTDQQGQPLPAADRSSPHIESDWIAYLKQEPTFANSFVTYVYSLDPTSWLYKTEWGLRFISTAQVDSPPQVAAGFVVFMTKNIFTRDEEVWLYNVNNFGGQAWLLDDNNEWRKGGNSWTYARPGTIRVRLSAPKMNYDPLTGRIYIAWGRNWSEGAPFQPRYRSCWLDTATQTGSCASYPPPAMHIDRWVNLQPTSPSFQGYSEINLSGSPLPAFLPGAPGNGVVFSGAGPGYGGFDGLFASVAWGDFLWDGFPGMWSANDSSNGMVVLQEGSTGPTGAGWGIRLVQRSLSRSPFGWGGREITPHQAGVIDGEAIYSRQGVAPLQDQVLAWSRYHRAARNYDVHVKRWRATATPQFLEYDGMFAAPAGFEYKHPGVDRDRIVWEQKNRTTGDRTVLTATCTP